MFLFFSFYFITDSTKGQEKGPLLRDKPAAIFTTSRLASSYDAMLLLMLFLFPAGPHLSGELAGFFWRRKILFAVIS